MNFQLNFTSSPQKERELLAFLVNECDCTILKGYGEDKNFSVNIQEAPSLHLYVIVPQSYANIVRIEAVCNQDLGANFSVYPFDENGCNFPLIRYERFEDLYRMYAGISTMDSQSKTAIKAILKRIKQWVKTNATSRRREGTPFCGITVYNLT